MVNTANSTFNDGNNEFPKRRKIEEQYQEIIELNRKNSIKNYLN